MIAKYFDEHCTVLKKTLQINKTKIEEVADVCIQTIKNGNKILFCGNGGSAADCQHIAAEMVGTYQIKDRNALPAIALTTDTSAITSIGNDFGYDFIFSRQIEALANANDIVFGISTSGNSTNVLNALKIAKDKGCITIGLSGNDGGNMSSLHHNIIVPSNNTPRIQEMHILIGHILCEIVDNEFAN